MLYSSTRGQEKKLTSANAIKKGLADDGGLLVPESIPLIDMGTIERMADMDYRQRAEIILKQYLDDYTEEELRECINRAYQYPNFDCEEIAPVRKVDEGIHVLELWHGPTSAFKDMALQILPHFMVKAIHKTGDESQIVILVATSGDTGKAALEGFKDVAGTRIIVFYPANGVSEIQKMQMTTQEGNNVEVFAVNGNFDDTQNGVKNIFNNKEIANEMLKNNMKFSSANSMNWGRLVPQIVYYFSAYCDMLAEKAVKPGEEVNFVVPTGNFGNILAGYYAKSMGLPIKNFICASNTNNVLTDFIHTGVYNKNRLFKATNSPSMDILISSNLERLLFLMSDKDTQKIRAWMEKLVQDGVYQVDDVVLEKIKEDFYAGWASEEQTLGMIKSVYDKHKYLMDTHTAVAYHVYESYVKDTGDDSTKTVIVSTANPYKFNDSVCSAVFEKEDIKDMSEFEKIKSLADKTGVRVPEGLSGLDQKPVRFRQVCDKEEMEQVLKKILQII